MKIFQNNLLYYFIILYILGAVATLANEPFSIFPLIFALGLGIYLINFTPSLLKTFVSGWILGFGWFSVGLYWIGSAFIVADTYTIFLMPVAILLLPSLLAVFWGLACVSAKFISRNKKFSIINIIVFISLFEYLRAKIFTGFPWLMPSMIFSSNEYLIQVFSFIGSFSANLVVLTISVLPLILLSSFKGKYTLSFLLLIPIITLFFLGIVRYNSKNLLQSSNQLITIVQPNIKQKNKWDLRKRDQHLNKLAMLSTSNKDDIMYMNNIIIWPETSFAGSIPGEIKLLSDISKKILKNSKSILIVGLLRSDESNLFNSLVFLNSKGQIIYRYDKTKLVPFGEYIPFRKHLNLISDFLPQKDFSRGNLNPNPYLDGVGNIITLICYEILFTDDLMNRISKNTNLLINITNDAWFGKTIGPHQHLALAKIKAVEFGLPLVRVANTGISVFVSPYGEIISKIPLNKESAKTFNLIPGLKNTLYKTYGELTFVLSILILIIINKTYISNYRENLFYEK